MRIFLIKEKKDRHKDMAEGKNVGFGLCLILGDDLDKVV